MGASMGVGTRCSHEGSIGLQRLYEMLPSAVVHQEETSSNQMRKNIRDVTPQVRSASHALNSESPSYATAAAINSNKSTPSRNRGEDSHDEGHSTSSFTMNAGLKSPLSFPNPH